MNPKLLSYIKELSEKDKKTFSQKVLKLFEEGGELAKKALPYDSAPGTLHRMTSRDAILEEVADVILVALSIGYDLGMDDDDLESVMKEKSRYWNKIQENESQVISTSFPFELHVTILNKENSWQHFQEVCAPHGYKPLLIKNYSIGDKALTTEMLTAFTMKSPLEEAYAELDKMDNILSESGYIVTRKKIETVPWHPASVSMRDDKQQFIYFENHMKIRLQEDHFNALALAGAGIANTMPTDTIGISWNAAKPAVNGIRTYYFTYRAAQSNRVLCADKVNYIAELLRKNKFIIEVSGENNIELAMYDSNQGLDDSWVYRATGRK